MTLRDSVWHETIEQLQRTGKFKISDLPFDEGQRHTVRRALKSMEEFGWLERETECSAIWRVGPTARRSLNISVERIEQAQR